jgi:hypothetical protein
MEEPESTVIDEQTPEPIEEPEGTMPEGTAPPPERPEGDEPPEIDQKKINKAFAEMRIKEATARRENAYLKGRLDAIEKKVTATPEPPAEPQQPRRDDFEDEDQFYMAVADYRADQKIKEYQRQEEARRESDQGLQVEAEWERKQAEARQVYEDFDDVVNVAVPINAPMADVIKQSDLSADIAYYLGKNLGEAARIYNMPPMKAALALGRIEAEISAIQKTKPKVPISDTPAPIIPPKGGAAPLRKDPNKMTFEEYKAARQSGEI